MKQDVDEADARETSGQVEGEQEVVASATMEDRPHVPDPRLRTAAGDSLPGVPLPAAHLSPTLSMPHKVECLLVEDEDEDEALDEDGQPRFVGNLSIRRDEDEPILRDNKRRFVLFPIQYHEVSYPAGRGRPLRRGSLTFCA